MKSGLLYMLDDLLAFVPSPYVHTRCVTSLKDVVSIEISAEDDIQRLTTCFQPRLLTRELENSKPFGQVRLSICLRSPAPSLVARY
jgi:hypothetical protein